MASIFGSEKDILNLEIYFKKHEVRDFLLHLSPVEYEILYVRSHFVSTLEDFKARVSEHTFTSTIYQRPHLTNDSAEPVIQCQVAIRIPERFAMDAPDVACFLLICSQHDVNYTLLSRFHLIAMLMVTDYYQMETIAFLLLRHNVRMTHVMYDPLTCLNALLHIFGPGHPYCDQLLSRMAQALDIQPSKIVELMQHRRDPLLFTTTSLHEHVRDKHRANRYYGQFRSFTCDICHLDLNCKPVGRYVYTSARCWPCCGSLIHVTCMPPLWSIKRCHHCGMAYYLGTPQWARQSSTTRHRVSFLRQSFHISLTDSLPSFHFSHPSRRWDTPVISVGLIDFVPDEVTLQFSFLFVSTTPLWPWIETIPLVGSNSFTVLFFSFLDFFRFHILASIDFTPTTINNDCTGSIHISLDFWYNVWSMLFTVPTFPCMPQM